jgi:chromosome segregation ATPase
MAARSVSMSADDKVKMFMDRYHDEQRQIGVLEADVRQKETELKLLTERVKEKRGAVEQLKIKVGGALEQHTVLTENLKHLKGAIAVEKQQKDVRYNAMVGEEKVMAELRNEDRHQQREHARRLEELARQRVEQMELLGGRMRAAAAATDPAVASSYAAAVGMRLVLLAEPDACSALTGGDAAAQNEEDEANTNDATVKMSVRRGGTTEEMELDGEEK